MTARPRRTTTLVGPDRLILAAATTGLVALASGATALLVLTGTSTVSQRPAPSMPLSTPSPVTSPGVIVLPPDRTSAQPRAHHVAAVPRRAVPAALAFVAPAAPFVPAVVPAPVRVVPAVAPVPPTPAVPVPVIEPPYVPAPDVAWPDDDTDVPIAKPHSDAGQHLARGHAKHAKPGTHAKHAKRGTHEKHEKHVISAKHHRTHGVAVHEQDD
jgi:hypothetical protein